MYTTSQNNLTVGGISVIVPVYNGEKYIKNCLDMLLDQDGDNFEVIVVNDGSTDKTADIVKSIHDEKLVYFEQENKGVSAARNKGIELSRGDWVVFCDVDDEVKQGYIQDINMRVKEYPDYDVFCYAKNDVSYKFEKDFVTIDGLQALKKTLYSVTQESKPVFEGCCYFKFDCPWSKVYKKSLLLSQNLFFNIKIFYGEDSLFVLHVFSYANKIAVIYKGYYDYIQNEDSVCHSIAKESEKLGFIEWQDAIVKLIKARNDLWGDKELKKVFDSYLNNLCIYYGIYRIIYSLRFAKKSSTEILYTIKQLAKKLYYTLEIIGGGLSKTRIKVFFAMYFPRLFERYILKKHN